jgi:hypothetical protein
VTGPTDSAWPEAISIFEEFLSGQGLACLRRDADPEARGKLLQYGSAMIGVRMVFDQRVWHVEAASVSSRPDEWYDAVILRDFLLGGQAGDVLPLDQQIDTIRQNWPAILIAFGPMRRVDTHSRPSETTE